jgi:hypothetical protein
MKTNKLTLLMVLASFFLMTSCSVRLVDFTVISSKNVSLKIDKSQGIRVTGASVGFLGMGASIKGAMDKALQSAGPDYDLLVDGVVSIQDYVLVNGYKVEGTAISTSKLKAALGNDGYNNWCKEHNIFDAENQVKN